MQLFVRISVSNKFRNWTNNRNPLVVFGHFRPEKCYIWICNIFFYFLEIIQNVDTYVALAKWTKIMNVIRKC